MPGGGGVEVIARSPRRSLPSASSPCRSPTPPRTSSRSSGPARAATSRSRSRAMSSPPRSAACATVTRSSRRGWRASSSTPLPARCPEAEIDPELDQLTMREREVLRLIARGYMYKEVAQQLDISAADRRGPRQRGAPQAPALEPPRAEPLGGRAAARRLTKPAPRSETRGAPPWDAPASSSVSGRRLLGQLDLLEDGVAVLQLDLGLVDAAPTTRSSTEQIRLASSPSSSSSAPLSSCRVGVVVAAVVTPVGVEPGPELSLGPELSPSWSHSSPHLTSVSSSTVPVIVPPLRGRS